MENKYFKICERCDGKGFVPDWSRDEEIYKTRTCYECGGKKFIVTNQGNDLMQFLTKMKHRLVKILEAAKETE